MGLRSWSSLVLLAVSLSMISTVDAHNAECTSLASLGSTLIPGYPSQIYAAQVFQDNSTFTANDTSSPVTITGLPEFCRFGAYFNTSAISQVQLEVWLPEKDNWNKRFAFVGNGGDSGEVFYSDMGTALSRHGFAVASTDTGHKGALGDGTFAINNLETQIDFGYRAVHLSGIFAKNVVRQYYGLKSVDGKKDKRNKEDKDEKEKEKEEKKKEKEEEKEKKKKDKEQEKEKKKKEKEEKKKKKNDDDFYSYYIGCSSGGKQGLKEIEKFPDEYDGVLAGSPAYWWSHLLGWIVQSNLNNPVNSSGYISGDTWTSIHTGIISQCDGIDGVEDGVITDPRTCTPDFAALNLTDAQITTAQSFYTNWTNPLTGELIFPGYNPGAEFQGAYWWAGTPFEVGPDYFKYSILNFTSSLISYVFESTSLVGLVGLADLLNPGGVTVQDLDISSFVEHNGKLLTYVGMADPLIPLGSATHHYESVRSKLGDATSDSFRLFTVPGMGHCAGNYGAGAVNFGAWPFSGGEASDLDKEHDIVLALIDWVENDNAPETIIASQYVNDDKSQGVELQRPLCPYPTLPTYKGGDQNSASSFVCQ